MHIQQELLLSTPAGVALAAGGFVLTGVGTAVGLRKFDYERMPQVALLSAVFFVASSINVPVGPTCVHLVLNGLMGLILGWAAFPAVLIALVLQSVFMGMGGIGALGVNTLTMALPAVVCHFLFRRAVAARGDPWAFAAGVAAGVTAIVLSSLLVAGACFVVDRGYAVLSVAYAAASVALAVGEGLVTGSAIVFLRKVAPEVLQVPQVETGEVEVSRA